MLQLAANMYDATTNRAAPVVTNGLGYPSVFRPIFSSRTSNGVNFVWIAGYREETDATVAFPGTAPGMIDVTSNLQGVVSVPQPGNMVYGIPLVVGAKKGWPNFNEFAMQTTITTTRKLQFSRPDANSNVNHTNQMYLLGISNVFGIEGWNSYVANFQRPLQMLGVATSIGFVSNESGNILNFVSGSGTVPIYANLTTGVRTNIASGTWSGYTGATADPSFQVPIFTNYWILTNAQYQFNDIGDPPNPRQGRFVPTSPGTFESNSQSMFPLPHWYVGLKTQVRFILVDTGVTPNRIVDYVNLSSSESPIDVTAINASDATQCNGQDSSNGGEWCTNRQHGSTSVSYPTYGILDQIQVSMGNITPSSWQNYIIQSPVGQDIPRAINFFQLQFGLGVSDSAVGVSNVFDAPFSPFRSILYYTSWEANDPLVHYTVGDLLNGNLPSKYDLDDANSKSSTITNLGRLNLRYEPWGGGNSLGNSQSKTKFDMAVKDPGVTGSDGWNFPTNKLPNVGWLGQVHRGTPWQTVNLKATPVDPTNEFKLWQKYTGDTQFVTNVGQISTNLVPVWNGNTNTVLSNMMYDAYFSVPTNDYRILDLFSTALSDNATRGRLSVNQTNLASWSAVLSGVNVLTNGQFNNGNTFIQPAGIYDPTAPPPLVQILNGINTQRTNFPNGSFQRMGDILTTPALSVKSPYLNYNYTNQITDAMYERIPQQILGLLQCDAPRFVIYAYGQTLKPAEHSLVTSGTFFGLCTNYQVTAETATRTVVRIEGGTNNPHAVIESFNVLPPDY
jgi:hypothetical protein